jgi:cysteine-rich repeat protein
MGAGASGYQSLNEHYEGSQSYQFKSKSDSGYSIVVFDLNSFGVSLENGATYTLEAMVWANAPDFARIYGVVDNVSDFASNRVGTSLFHGGNRQWQKLSYTFVASGTNHKIILEIKGHNGADAYFDNLEMRKHERACFDACEIANTRITQKCTRNDNCNIRDKIEMYIEYEKSDFDICPANPILQIDAKDSEETCSIEYNGGDISGMTLNCTPEKIGSVSGKVTCRGNWTIPDIPNACKGKEVSAFSVGIYKNGVDSNNHVAGTWENVRGSFKFTDSPTTPKTCGDGAVQTPNDAGVNEQCDGTNLNNKKCQDVTSPVKYGTLSCKTDCTFDKTQCTLDQPRVPECGDGIISANSTEECDDNNVVSGDGCSSSCIREYCGDGIVNNGEQCDGTNLDGKTCSSVGRGAGSGLACYPNASGTGCTFDVSACPVLCTDDNHCDAQTEDATCDDCKTARFRTISASTKSFGVMFNATFTPSYFNPLKFIACKSGEDRQDCIDDFDAGSCGIDSACLCGSNLEKGCNLICNDESGDFYLYAEGFSQTAMSSQISNYECPHLQIDELEAARDDMQDLLERIVTAALVMTERNADPADIALMEQARGLALNLVLQLNNLIDDYETSYVTVDQINYALGSYRNTKPTIMSLINQALS